MCTGLIKIALAILVLVFMHRTIESTTAIYYNWTIITTLIKKILELNYFTNNNLHKTKPSNYSAY